MVASSVSALVDLISVWPRCPSYMIDTPPTPTPKEEATANEKDSPHQVENLNLSHVNLNLSHVVSHVFSSLGVHYYRDSAFQHFPFISASMVLQHSVPLVCFNASRTSRCSYLFAHMCYPNGNLTQSAHTEITGIFKVALHTERCGQHFTQFPDNHKVLKND